MLRRSPRVLNLLESNNFLKKSFQASFSSVNMELSKIFKYRSNNMNSAMFDEIIFRTRCYAFH